MAGFQSLLLLQMQMAEPVGTNATIRVVYNNDALYPNVNGGHSKIEALVINGNYYTLKAGLRFISQKMIRDLLTAAGAP